MTDTRTCCWPCRLTEHPGGPHSWMDDEDITQAGMTLPTTAEGWAALASRHPCSCHCTKRDDTPNPAR